MLDAARIDQLNAELSGAEPATILARMQQEIPRLTVAFSGSEDVVLVHLASRLADFPPVFTLDTGRLHAETLAFIERIREHYQVPLAVLHPDSSELDKLIKNKGLFSFYNDGHEECCQIRKVQPLGRYLQQYDAWVTGQRQDQSPTRQAVPVVELDSSFSTASHPIVKINPLANFSSQQVWQMIRMLDIPYNPLHDRGFISIGCEPCTRPVGPGQHEREGRWWWEEATIRECGLHRGNLSATTED